jgi:sialate O-acetylesterase
MKASLFLGAVSSVLALFPPCIQANVKLPKVIDSHMVLQRDMPLPIWGWADPGERVVILIDDHKAAATADKEGNWKVTLPALKADGKSHAMSITGKNKIELKDILIGEVWVGSGQSNMEMSVAGSKDGKKAIAAANHPKIRLFHVPKLQTKTPAKDVNASWKICSSETVPNFAAVLYFFGLRLHKDLDVPIGLINSSWGGSPIEPWTVAGKQSGGMYNAMIAPLQPFAIRGVTWYQGESNLGNGLSYYPKMKALIEGWRKTWGEAKMPFYLVQLAPFSGYGKAEMGPLWEAQAASLKIPHTGMAVITDLVDNIGDIHPQNKYDVGNRLALWALAKDYGKKDLVYSGPLYKSMKIDGDKIVLTFAHVGGGLKSRDSKPLSEFQIAGKDGKFVPAEALIKGEHVVVSAKGVAEPKQVRFGWRNIANPNLMNKEGLPASPFQTDHWQGGTGEEAASASAEKGQSRKSR